MTLDFNNGCPKFNVQLIRASKSVVVSSASHDLWFLGKNCTLKCQPKCFLKHAVDFYFGRISFEWLSEKSFGRKNFQRFYFVCGQNINLAFWNKENITEKIIEEDITLSLARDQRASFKNVGFMGEHRNWGKSSIYHLMPSWARNHQCSTSGTLSAF